MGWDVAMNLRRWGFYPTGAGCVEGEVRRVGTCPIDLRHRGPLREIVGISAAANLTEEVARRQARAAVAALEDHGFGARVEAVQVTASCPGTAVVLAARFENGVGGASALGRKGLPAEEVGRKAASSLLAYLSRDAALDQHQADQLVIPAALARGQSFFTVARVTSHLVTVAEVASAFLGDVVSICGAPGEEGTVCVKGIAS
jgi:RNA 3'-terminal phosphate cyclase (ATP)